MANNLADVVRAALTVLDSHGLEFCSMRRVAATLDVQPSALYHHVPDKQTLLALMADRIVEGVRVADDGLPEQCAADVAHALRDAMLSIRDGADVVATASAFRLGVSRVEAELAAALEDRDGARTLLLFVFGHTQATQMHRLASGVGAIDPDPDLDGSFDRGLQIVLRGLLNHGPSAARHDARA